MTSKGALKPPFYFKQRLIGSILGFIIFLISRTYRYRVFFTDPEDEKLFLENKKNKLLNQNLIFAVFHQDEMAALPFFSYQNICILVSQSKDGQLLASALHILGYDTVRGSSHRGGVAGLIAVIKRAMNGQKIAIAIDGPRGPRYQVKEGVIKLSEKSRRPIMPVRAFPHKSWYSQKSWSHSRLPKPFSRVDLYLGKTDFYSKESLHETLLQLCPKSNT